MIKEAGKKIMPSRTCSTDCMENLVIKKYGPWKIGKRKKLRNDKKTQTRTQTTGVMVFSEAFTSTPLWLEMSFEPCGME